MLVTYRQRQTLAATSRSLLKLLKKVSAVPSLLEKRHYCCLVPRPHYSARPTRFGSRGPSEGPLQGPLVTEERGSFPEDGYIEMITLKNQTKLRFKEYQYIYISKVKLIGNIQDKRLF